MARATLETQRARLADRLRPIYADMRSDEFDRMVARIADIELHGAASDPVDIGAAARRRSARDARSAVRAMAS